MAQLPLHVMRRDGNNVVDGNDHPAHALLSTSPNQWQSSYDWREQAQQVVLTNGNAITRLRRDRRGQPIELDLFEPEHIGEPVRVPPVGITRLRRPGAALVCTADL